MARTLILLAFVLLFVARPAHAQSAAVSAARARRAEQMALFNALSDAGAHCGGMRTASPAGRVSIVFAAACFFVPGTTDVRADAAGLVARIAHALSSHRTREYGIGAVLPDGTPHAFRTSAAQAAALVEALVAAGVARAHLAAVGYGDREDEEVYDGPASIAPGNALVEISLEPSTSEFPGH